MSTRVTFGNGSVVMVAGLLAGCSAPVSGSGQAARGVDHLRCAALIGAADRLAREGKVAADPAFLSGALVAGMTHLNAYSIPNGIGEKQAFDAINGERDRILRSLAPARIMEEAKTCMEQVPSSR